MESLTLKDICKIYNSSANSVTALNKISLEISPHEFVAITGTSGSGKSTLMHIMGCLDIPTSGEYFIGTSNVSKLNKDELAHIRNKKIGFIFQRFNLLPDLDALNNVALPLLYAGETEKKAQIEAEKFLKLVGLQDRKDHYPYQLSGGQQQRVAVARSLINKPTFILADEPTGNLDSVTGKSIMALFKELNEVQKVTIVLVTHDPEISKQAKRIIELVDGKIKSNKVIS